MNGCGVFISARWPSTSALGSLKLMWIRSTLVPCSDTRRPGESSPSRQLFDDCGLHLEVPGEVVVAGLQYGPRGRRRHLPRP